MISTKRLILRPWQKEDLAALPLIFGDPDVMRFSDQGPLSKPAQRAWLNDAIGGSATDPLLKPLAILPREQGRIAGYVSLSSNPRRVASDEVELGFRLARQAWGKGYATEAASTVIDHCRRLDTVRRIVAIVDPNNTRSLRVLEKIGLRYEKDISFAGYDYPDHLYVALNRLD